MKSLAFVTAIFCVFCGAAWSADYPVEFETRGDVGISEAACQAGVYVLFYKHELLTDLAREAFRQKNCTVKESEEGAAAKVYISGIYGADGTGLESISMPLGTFVQKGEERSKSNGENLATLSPGDAAVGTGTTVLAYAIGAVSLPFALGDVLQSLTKSVGIGGAFNKLVSGHKDGFCAHDCERRDWATQTVILLVKYSEGGKDRRTQISAKLRSPVLTQPAEIINPTFLEAAKVLH